MSRINTNISSLQAMHRLAQNNSDLSLRMQRLSSGLKINSGKDAPAGLIASETLRSEMSGINQAVDNSQRAGNVLNTAEGALSEVSALLLEVQGLTNQAANTGALSPEEIKANQLQVDAIMNSIDRISNTTQFNGVKLLNGGLDYTTSGINQTEVTAAHINQAKIPDNGFVTVAVDVTQSAQTATYGFVTGANPGLSATNNLTLEIAGNVGSQQVTLAGGATKAEIAAAINQNTNSTGVVATASATGIRLDSVGFGAKQFVSVNVINEVTGLFAGGTGTTAKTYGQNAAVNINGAQAEVDGLNASVRTANLDLNLDLGNVAGVNVVGGTTNFTITGGGAKFQLGSTVNDQSQTNIGLQSIATSSLGNNVAGFLSSLLSGGANSLVSGNTTQAQKIITEAIAQVSTLRGRIGAFQKNILETNVSSLNVALENVTASESSIRDADFAAETAALTRAQILVQANTSVLSQANSSPQSVLSLLSGR